MSRVLVTGATTPIGLALIKNLCKNKRVTQILAVGAEGRLGFSGDKIRYVQVDLTRPRRLHDLLFDHAKNLKVCTLVHLAMHRDAAAQGAKVHRLNVDATRSLLGMAERHPTIKNFIYRSYGEIYDVRAELPSVLQESHPINLSPTAPQWLRDRIEADLSVCTRMGMSELRVTVLRCSECIAPKSGSQLHDYLKSSLCLRPAGFDPMVNVLSLADLAAALEASIHRKEQGIFNIRGADTLPLSHLIRKSGCHQLALPGPLLGPLYRGRRALRRGRFRYTLNNRRFHLSGILDGTRAAQLLKYSPKHPLELPAG